LGKLINLSFKASAPDPACQFTDLLLEPSLGLRGYPSFRLLAAGETKAQEYPVIRPCHRAFVPVDLEFEPFCDEGVDAPLYPELNPFASHMNIIVISVANQVIGAPLKLLVPVVLPEVREQE
jgi:hypothetical protein